MANECVQMTSTSSILHSQISLLLAAAWPPASSAASVSTKPPFQHLTTTGRIRDFSVLFPRLMNTPGVTESPETRTLNAEDTPARQSKNCGGQSPAKCTSGSVHFTMKLPVQLNSPPFPLSKMQQGLRFTVPDNNLTMFNVRLSMPLSMPLSSPDPDSRTPSF